MPFTKPNAQEPVSSELILSAPASLFCTHLIMGYYEKSNYLELLLEKDYLLSLAFRTFCAFIYILMIKFLTRYLDIKRPWSVRKWSRCFIQVFYGLFGVVIFDFILAALHFDNNRIQITETAYYNAYFLPLFIYIAVINVYYNYQCLMPKKVLGVSPQVLSPLGESLADKQAIEISRYVAEHDICCIFSSNKVNFAKNRSGESVIWNHTLAESIAALPADQFYQVNRSHIVRRDAIDLIIEPEKHSITVVLKPPLQGEVKIPDVGISAFQKWWSQREAAEKSIPAASISMLLVQLYAVGVNSQVFRQLFFCDELMPFLF